MLRCSRHKGRTAENSGWGRGVGESCAPAVRPSYIVSGPKGRSYSQPPAPDPWPLLRGFGL